MRNRILSILLVAVMIVCSLPISLVSMAADSEIVLTETNFPKTVTSVKLANNYPTAAGTFKAGATWDPGTAADGTEYASLYSTANVASFVYSEGWATLTTSASGEANKTIGTELTFKSTNTIDANYISVRIDATNIVSKKYARIQLSSTSGLYASNIAGATYYFLPDASEENPEPVIEERKMSGDVGSSKWNTRMIINIGEKGTLYLPETMFATGEEKTSDVDFSGYITEDWRLSHGSRKSNSLRFVFTNAAEFAANEALAFGEMNWVCNAPFPLSYNALYTAEDFSDSKTVTASAWGSNGYSVSSLSVADGVWKHTMDAASWTEGTLSYYPDLTLPNGITEDFEALAYDIDLTTLENSNPYFQVTYGVKDTDKSKTSFKRRYIVANGEVFAVWEDGKIDTITVGNNAWPWFALPTGFKGTVVIPFETFKDCENSNADYDATSYNENGSTDLYKNDDVNKFSIEIAMNNIAYADKGKVVTYDNVGYLTTLNFNPAGEGMTFTDTKVQTTSKIAEDIKTIEAWVKLDASSTGGTIIADKYYSGNETTSVAGINMYITSSGKPALHLCDGTGDAVTLEATDDVRTGEWTHIAFVKDTANLTLKAYINGMLSGETALAETMGDVLPYHTLTVGHLSAQSSAGFNTKYLAGAVQDIRLWSNARTSSEIMFGVEGIAGTEEGLIANWSLNGDTAYTNIQGNEAYNLKNYISEISAESDAETYASLSAMPEDGYTMVILPDTQISNAHYPENFVKLYDWIIDNEETLNIKYVMGIGDIVDTYAAGEKRTAEWQRAKEQFDRLTEAGIPWSAIMGNHDVVGGSVGKNDSTDFNTYFPISEISEYSWFGGSMLSTESDNAFYKITVGDTKYIIIGLDVEPSDAQLEWANQVCYNNPDSKIIVTTHEYLNDGATYLTTGYSGRNQGIDVWEKLVSKHENIIMAFGGHVAAPDIQVKEDYGVNGNKVINALIDSQAFDYSEHSLVALLKFSADGSEVTLNYYSVTGQCFMDLDSQMTLSVGGTVTDEPLADLARPDFTVSKFYDANEIRDFKYFSNDTAYLETWGNSTVAIDNSAFTWDNQTLKLSVPETYTGDATKANIPVYFKKLPNVTSKNTNAYSFWVDCSDRTRITYAKLMYYYKNSEGNTDVAQPGADSVVYLISDDGTVTSQVCTGTWSSVDIPAGFVGSIVVPFTSMKSNYGSGEQLSNATFLSETASNSINFQITILEANPGDVFRFNHINYLDIYEAEDLVITRKALLGDVESRQIDVNGDGEFGIRDLVRMKRVLVQ